MGRSDTRPLDAISSKACFAVVQSLLAKAGEAATVICPSGQISGSSADAVIGTTSRGIRRSNKENIRAKDTLNL